MKTDEDAKIDEAILLLQGKSVEDYILENIVIFNNDSESLTITLPKKKNTFSNNRKQKNIIKSIYKQIYNCCHSLGDNWKSSLTINETINSNERVYTLTISYFKNYDFKKSKDFLLSHIKSLYF